MPDARPRSAAIRKTPKKGTSVGSGGQRRRRLEGRGPTPPAEQRVNHPATRRAAPSGTTTGTGAGRTGGRGVGAGAGRTGGPGSSSRGDSRRGAAVQGTSGRGAGGRGAGGRGAGARGVPVRGAGGRGTPGKGRPARVPGRRGNRDAVELVTGRNAVGEALAAGITVTTLYLAERIDADDRIRSILRIAADRSVPVLEGPRAELDRLSDGAIHQGVALAVTPYDYATPGQLLERAATDSPLLVALDGITDPHNLGAVIRSAAAFGADGVVIPERRAAGVSAGVWKASAGAVARIRVARAGNLNRALQEYRRDGVAVVGLAGEGSSELGALTRDGLALGPLVLVVGAEGRGLSRLVRETCDLTVAIPVSDAVESLNASVASGIVLHEIARVRRAG